VTSVWRSAGPEEIRVDLSEQLADIFIRAPHQLVNYNAVIDGTKCEDAYDAGLRMAHAEWKSTAIDGTPGYRLVDSTTGEPIELPPGTSVSDLFGVSAEELPSHAKFNNVPEQRSLVEDCDPALGNAAANPSFTQVINTLALGVGGIFLAILALALCLGVWASAIYTLVLAIKALWNLVAGILPGGQRLGLTRTVSEVVIALIVVLAAVVFLMAYLQVVTSVFNSADGPPMKRFALLDLLLIAGLVVWLRMRKALKRAAATLAQKMAARPRSKPTKIGTAFGSGNRWQQARSIGARTRQTVGAVRQGAVVGGRGAATAGHAGGKAAGAGAFAAFAGVWGGARAAKWAHGKVSPRMQPVMAADSTDAAGAPVTEIASTGRPPDSPTAGARPGRGPDGRPPRHSHASLARQRAVRRQLSVRAHPASPLREHPPTRTPAVEPAAPEPAPAPAPVSPPRAKPYDRVVSNGRVHYVRRAPDTQDRRDPTRVPM
jgi:hypothetical protein